LVHGYTILGLGDLSLGLGDLSLGLSDLSQGLGFLSYGLCRLAYAYMYHVVFVCAVFMICIVVFMLDILVA
jgi:hypothetical protein